MTRIYEDCCHAWIMTQISTHSAIELRPLSKGVAAWLWPAGVVLAVAAGLVARGADWSLLVGALAVQTVLSLMVCARGRWRTGRLGLANQVTLARAGLVAVLAAALIQPDWFRDQAWLMAGLVLTVLLLDGVDGWLARRRSEVSTFGARFDMEVDAALIAVLSVGLVVTGKVGLWVLAIGLMRYAFVGAAWIWPWLSTPLPTSFRRKLVCVWQVAALLVCLTPLVGPALATPVLAVALLALVVSFSVDVAWLWRHSAPPEQQQEVS